MLSFQSKAMCMISKLYIYYLNTSWIKLKWKQNYFCTDNSGTQGVLTPNATVIATQRLVRQNTAIEGGHASQVGVQMRLTRVSPQPGHSLDSRAPGEFSTLVVVVVCLGLMKNVFANGSSVTILWLFICFIWVNIANGSLLSLLTEFLLLDWYILMYVVHFLVTLF